MDKRRNGRFPSNHGVVFLVSASLMAAIPAGISAQQTPSKERCQAPDTSGQTMGGQATPNPRSENLKLSECGGVLKPPATGDSELEKPAPPVGNTPVIPPNHVPEEHGNDTPKNQ